MIAEAKRTELVEKFQAFVVENGPSFLWGKIKSPFSGCFYRNAVAFVHGDNCFVTADLQSFTGEYRATDYARHVVDLPMGLSYKGLKVGCIRVEDIENVLSGVEIHPMAELAPNVPFALVWQVIQMADDLDLDVSGLFTCPFCKTDLAKAEGVEYLRSEFKGNGGIGIEVGAPVCYECLSERTCSNCNEECEPEQTGVEGSDASVDKCIWCAETIACSCCGDSVDLSWQHSEENILAYQDGLCVDCSTLERRGEIENQKYLEVANQTGELF